MAEKTRREILAEAFDEAEHEETEAPAKGAEAGAKDDSAGDSGVDSGAAKTQESADAGEAGSGEKSEKDDSKPEVKKENIYDRERKAAEKRDDKKEGVATPEPPKDKAPGSWKPAERELWGQIPEGARAAIRRRELQIQQELSQTDTIRRFSGDLARIVQPHLPIMQAQGVQPLAAIDNVLKTASYLYQGNQETKAAIIAQLIANYDVDIKTLDHVLSQGTYKKGGATVPQQQQGGGIPAWAQPIFGFMQNIESSRQQREQSMLAEAHTEIEAAADKMPFLDDLRMDMADLMEKAAQRGRVMTLEQAYQLAASMDPDISKIVTQQRAAAAQRGITPRKRAAASTVRGVPQGNSGSDKPKSRREVLSEAWDDAGGE